MSTRRIWFLACMIACASGVHAQTRIDKSFTAVSKDCSGIQWSEEALTEYPSIDTACQGVEERNGKTYVKFQGTVKRNVNRGEQLVVNFKDGGVVTLTPPADMSLYVRGKSTKVADLRRGDELNFYVAEERLAAHFPEIETATARFIIVPISSGEPTERMAAALPATASQWPLLALAGLLTMGLGGLLTLCNRRSR